MIYPEYAQRGIGISQVIGGGALSLSTTGSPPQAD